MIDDIILEVLGVDKPNEFQTNFVYRTARDVEAAMPSKSAVKATLTAAYFDVGKATIATNRIFNIS